jgi:MFS family permease
VWSGLAGFALLGTGLAVVVPLAVTAAARLGRPGPSLAITTSFGYLGALAGPAIIGGLADLTSLPVAMGVIVLLSALIVVLAGAIRPRSRTAGAGARLAEPGPIREECWGDANRHGCLPEPD